MSGRLTIVRPGLPLPDAQPGELVVSFDEFRDWTKGGRVFAHLLRHREGRLLVHRLESAGRPLPLGLALRAMSRGRVWVEDVAGRRRILTAGLLAGWAGQAATEPFRVSTLLRNVATSVDAVERAGRTPRPMSLDLSRQPLYMRTDLSFGVRAGGSVGHIAGVVNTLDSFTGPAIVLTTDDVPTLKPGIEVHHVTPGEAFWNFAELPTFVLNDACDAAAEKALGGREPAFVYQRYSLNNFSGLRVARRHRVPLVLEYNGSEIWMGRHWGRPLRHEALSQRIEQLNLTCADLTVVVSRVMRDEVVARGVDASAVFVNPNGVDPDRYRPDVDGRAVRERYGLGPFVVIGFIGTFGPWHGAEVLARAFVRLLARRSRECRSPSAADDRRRRGDAGRPADTLGGRRRGIVGPDRPRAAGTTVRSIWRRATSSRRRTSATPTARRFSDRRPSCSSTWRWARASSRRISSRSAKCSSMAAPPGSSLPATSTRLPPACGN